MTQHRTGLQTRGGFTMVVIAALFIAFAVVAGAIIERNTALQFITRREAAKQQLQRLNNALIEYSVYNASGTALVYPCPAATNVATNLSTFGTSVNTAGVQDCSSIDHAAEGISVYRDRVVEGMVPVQALAPYGISLNDAFDPWGNRIMYVVNSALTTGGSKSNTHNPVMQHLSITLSSISNIAPNPVKPDFILISYGRDGLGAIRRNATTISIPCTYDYQSPYTYNCGMTTLGSAASAIFYSAPTYTASNAGGASYFDDILSWHNQ